MSDQDRNILRKADLSQTRIADLLGKKRQAVSKGVNSQRHYLNIDRIREIHAALSKEDSARASLLEKAAQHFLPDQIPVLFEKRFNITSNDPARTEFSELWVITSMPQELSEIGYIKRMVDAHLSDSDKKVEYFLPSKHVALELAQLIACYKANQKGGFADVLIYALGGVVYSPRYVIFEPSSGTEQRGFVQSDNSDFVRLPPGESKRLILSLEKAKLHEDAVEVYPTKE